MFPLKSKIIIGIPVFNEEKFIGETLQSIKSQSFNDFKVLISDNCSNDLSAEIILSEIKDDPRFFYFRQESNLGSINNWNFICKNVDCEYISIIGAHDILKKDFIKILSSELDTDSSISLAASGCIETFYPNSKTNIEYILNECNYKDSDPYNRFLSILSSISPLSCVAINCLIRFSFLNMFIPMPLCWGADVSLLSLLNYCGPFYVSHKVLYCKREFNACRATYYIERITGKKNNRQSYHHFPKYIIKHILFTLHLSSIMKLKLIFVMLFVISKRFFLSKIIQCIKKTIE